MEKPTLTKEEAIALLGGWPAALARALGITRGSVHQWPDRLDVARSDRVIGAAVRLGKTDEACLLLDKIRRRAAVSERAVR